MYEKWSFVHSLGILNSRRKNTSGKPFVGAGVTIGGSDDSDTQFGYGAHAGYALFLNKSVALEFGGNYNRTEDIDMIGVGVCFQIHFKK